MKENTILEEKVKRLEDKIDRTEQELVESKRTAQRYMDKVLDSSGEERVKFEEKY